MFKEIAKTTGWLAYWWVIALIFIGLTTVGWLFVRPWVLSLETRGTRQQLQYVDTQREALVSQLQAYQKLESEIAELQASGEEGYITVIQSKRAQQAGLISRMRIEASRIDAQFIPYEISKFLSTH